MGKQSEWTIEGRDVFIERWSDGLLETITREEAESRLNEYEALRELEKAYIRLYVGEITKPAWREFVRRSPEGQRLITLANIHMEGK